MSVGQWVFVVAVVGVVLFAFYRLGLPRGPRSSGPCVHPRGRRIVHISDATEGDVTMPLVTVVCLACGAYRPGSADLPGGGF